MIDHLTRQERIVLDLLSVNPVLKSGAILDALAAQGSKAGPQMVKVLVCKVRGKLQLEIPSVYGLGYQLSPKDRETLRLPQLDTPGTAYLKARAAVKGGADVVR